MKKEYTFQESFIICILFILLLFPTNSKTDSQFNNPKGDSLETKRETNYSPPFYPFFPLGIYGVHNSTEIWESWMNRFNTVIFGYAEPEDFEELNIEEMLYTCDVLGMKVLFETSFFLRENAMDELMDLVLRVVDHPSIYAWYIVDEPGLSTNGTLIDENMIRDAVETIRKIDDRPTFVQFSLQTINESLWEKSYASVPDFVDIISVDPYPNMPSTNHSIVTDWVDTILQYNAGRAKVWAVLTAQDFSQSQKGYSFDIPSEPEYMMDSVLALQRGVEGLLWFAFGQIEQMGFGAYKFPTSWDALGRVLRRISQVAPVLMGRENDIHIFPIDEKIEAAYAKRGNQTVLFLANHDYYWNGTDTEWVLGNITLTLQAPGVVSVSLIEPSGSKPLDFQLMGSTLTFNITINGGIIILIEIPNPISLLEFQNTLFVIVYCLILIVGLYRFKLSKKHHF
ncbi:MAG: hypothetical protein ACE5R6_11165 [Candidatus Heimdallarchaeota archaeon]